MFRLKMSIMIRVIFFRAWNWYPTRWFSQNHQMQIPSGELTVCYGKWPIYSGFSHGKMVIFHCYVSSPEGICKYAILAGLLGQILVLLLILTLLLASERISPSAPGESPSKMLNGSFPSRGEKNNFIDARISKTAIEFQQNGWEDDSPGQTCYHAVMMDDFGIAPLQNIM